MRGKAHSDELRAQVVAGLIAGRAAVELAREFGLDESVISRWKNAIPPMQLQPAAIQKAERIEGLLFDYLSANLTTLTRQAEVAGTEDYIRKQPAGELAVLHGVMADKGIRLLEAIARARETRSDSGGERPAPSGF